MYPLGPLMRASTRWMLEQSVDNTVYGCHTGPSDQPILPTPSVQYSASGVIKRLGRHEPEAPVPSQASIPGPP